MNPRKLWVDPDLNHHRIVQQLPEHLRQHLWYAAYMLREIGSRIRGVSALKYGLKLSISRTNGAVEESSTLIIYHNEKGQWSNVQLERNSHERTNSALGEDAVTYLRYDGNLPAPALW